MSQRVRLCDQSDKRSTIMQKQFKRIIAGLLLLALVATLIPQVAPTVNAVSAANAFTQQHYGDYSTLAMIYDQSSCYSMQGMCTDNTYTYSAKIGSNDARAIIIRTNKSTGAKTTMTDASTGYGYFTNLGHANALDIVTVNGKSNLFVTGGSKLTRLTISGSTLTTAGTYTATYNGAAASMTAVQIMSASDTVVKVLVKSGRTLYTGTLNPTASSGNIVLTKLCTLNLTEIRMKGTVTDYSHFTQQGFDYHDGKVFLPLTGNAYAETINQSIVAVYDIEGACGDVRNDPSLSFRVISGTYAGLFEIEDVAVCPMTGKLYFSTNRRKTASDTNYDAVSWFYGYTYDAAMSTTKADDFRWETIDNELMSVTDNGNVFNEASRFHGDINNNVMSQAIFSLSRSVVLKHDAPWVVEWKSTGNFGGGAMMLATERTYGVTDAAYLFRFKNSSFIAFGAWDGSKHNNYGLTLSNYGIDGTKEHVYRLTNKVASNGTNMVYLSVDGKELGAMNNYYINATAQGTTSNWVSGKDFTFSYIGSYGHPMSNVDLSYMQIWANGIPENAPEDFRWETSNDALVSATDEGITTNNATIYRGSISGGIYSKVAYRLDDKIVLQHDRPWSVEWQSDGGLTGGTFLLAASDGGNTIGAPFLFRYTDSGLVALGYRNATGHQNFGLTLSDYGINGSESHVYRLTNKIAADGSNMVYLSVDGEELGAMNNYYIGIKSQGKTSNWLNGKDLVFEYFGNTGYPINGTLGYLQVWENGAPEPEVSGVTGTIPAYLDRVNSASELEEGVPYIISDYKDSWLHYVLTSQYAERVSGSKVHKGYLLDGTASVNTTDLWYIKDGYLVYGAPDSNKYLLISYDSSSQGIVEMGNFNATNAAYVVAYSGDDFAIRGSMYLNRRGGTASDFVATAYSSAGGSYWHLDKLVKAQNVVLDLTPEITTLSAGNRLALEPVITVDGIDAASYKLSWSTSDSTIATVSADGTVSGHKAGQVTITATLSTANGCALSEPISISVVLTVKSNSVSTTATQQPSLVRVSSLQTGVPYVITEWNSGAALTGTMLYTTSSGYKGLSSTQGLMTTNSIDLNNAPVWYYNGTNLRYGSTSGSYLVYNTSNQIALGNSSAAGIINKVVPYGAQTFTMSPANSSSYVNQLGGSNYNVVGLYSSAYYSQWHFNQLLPKRTLTLTAALGSATITAGDTLTLSTSAAVNGTATSNYILNWSSSNTDVAVVNSNGVVTANRSGKAVITATLTEANSRSVDTAVSVQINIEVVGNAGFTATAVQAGKLVASDSLKIGAPYVITESNTGAILSGEMLYTTSTGYRGYNGTQGLKVSAGIDLNEALWYYDGTHLLFGSATGSNNYLVYNSSKQVTLGSASAANIFDNVSLYNAANKTFTISPSGATSGSTIYYLNQLGGGNYNATGLYHYAPTSLWKFSELVEEKTVSMNIVPEKTNFAVGQASAMTTKITINGIQVNDCQLSWTTSNASVATVSNGTVTAVGSGSATISVTLTGAEGDTFENSITIDIPVTIA